MQQHLVKNLHKICYGLKTTISQKCWICDIHEIYIPQNFVHTENLQTAIAGLVFQSHLPLVTHSWQIWWYVVLTTELLQFCIPYSGKFLRTINFIVFEDFTITLTINSSKSYDGIESYGSLVDPRNLICEIYRGETTSKIFCLENYLLYGRTNVQSKFILTIYV